MNAPINIADATDWPQIAARFGLSPDELAAGLAAHRKLGDMANGYGFLTAALELARWAGDDRMLADVLAVDAIIAGRLHALTGHGSGLTADEMAALQKLLAAAGAALWERLDRDGINLDDLAGMRETVAELRAKAGRAIMQESRFSTVH